MKGIPIYGHGAHDFVMREFEIGRRAALYEDSEWNTGWTAIDDLIYFLWAREQQERERQES